MDPRFNSTCFTPNPAGSEPGDVISGFKRARTSAASVGIAAGHARVAGRDAQLGRISPRLVADQCQNLTLNLRPSLRGAARLRLRRQFLQEHDGYVLTGRTTSATDAIVLNNMWAQRLGILRTTGRRKAARSCTRTGAGSTSRSRWTSTTARSAARSTTSSSSRRRSAPRPTKPAKVARIGSRGRQPVCAGRRSQPGGSPQERQAALVGGLGES